VLARSPGTRYRHYAPDAHVVLIEDPKAAFPRARAAYIGLNAPPDPDAFGLARTCPDVMQYSYELFDFFRRCDTMGMQVIFCQVVPPTGLGMALMDRLKRAADS
jgi:L-threonylcarbamoyladenylate synthase